VSQSEFLKSAAQLRKLAAKINDPEAHRRIISVAEEYEAMAQGQAAIAKQRKRSKAHLELVSLQAPRGKPLH
jgi:hypothetical protein